MTSRVVMLDGRGRPAGAGPRRGCDVADRDQVTATAQTVVQRFGAIDRPVNAAGIAVSGRVEELPDEAFEHWMRVNHLRHGALGNSGLSCDGAAGQRCSGAVCAGWRR